MPPASDIAITQTMDRLWPPCEICGGAVSRSGLMCETSLCFGTYERAIRIMATRCYSKDLEPYLHWIIDTKGQRIGNPDA